MKIVRLLIIMLIGLQLASFGQITTQVRNITFLQTIVGQKDSATVTINNNYNYTVSIKAITPNALFSVTPNVATIGPKGNVTLKVYYTPSQNIIDFDFIKIAKSDSSNALMVRLVGSGKYNDMYDATTFNKFDTDLRSALLALVDGHTSLGYDTGRNRMFENIDKEPGDTIECIYSGRRIKAATRTEAQAQGFNTEHSWPQSNFSQNEPMRSDINHLFPTDDVPNNRRSNYPFGKVVANVSYEIGGSKLGQDASGRTAFEPRDVHKGDLSRGMFYFMTRYPQNYGSFWDAQQEAIFRVWNQFDPVSLKEKNRNNGVQTYQGKRNPYIDHPEFVERINNFLTNAPRPTVSKFVLSSNAIKFDSVAVNDSLKLPLFLGNGGKKAISSISISAPSAEFRLSAQITSLGVESDTVIYLVFKPTSEGTKTSQITITADGSQYNVALSGVCKNGVGVNDGVSNVKSFSLEQNYPNPFNPTTEIVYNIAKSGYVNLSVYDLLGNKVKTLVDETKNEGRYSVKFDASTLSGGVYFYSLESGAQRVTKKLVLLK